MLVFKPIFLHKFHGGVGIHRGIESHFHIVFQHIIILVIHQLDHRIPDPKSRHQQGGTA